MDNSGLFTIMHAHAFECMALKQDYPLSFSTPKIWINHIMHKIWIGWCIGVHGFYIKIYNFTI